MLKLISLSERHATLPISQSREATADHRDQERAGERQPLSPGRAAPTLRNKLTMQLSRLGRAAGVRGNPALGILRIFSAQHPARRPFSFVPPACLFTEPGVFLELNEVSLKRPRELIDLSLKFGR
jgi:hypothetical protein